MHQQGWFQGPLRVFTQQTPRPLTHETPRPLAAAVTSLMTGGFVVELSAVLKPQFSGRPLSTAKVPSERGEEDDDDDDTVTVVGGWGE